MKTIKKTSKPKKAAPEPKQEQAEQNGVKISAEVNASEHTMLVVFALALVLLGVLFVINMLNISMKAKAEQVKGVSTTQQSEQTTISDELHDIDRLLYETDTHKDTQLPE
jgi:signal transduction histidine kinase